MLHTVNEARSSMSPMARRIVIAIAVASVVVAVITAVLGLWLTAAGNTLTAVAMAVILWSNRSGRAS
jgi:hypothetical protein